MNVVKTKQSKRYIEENEEIMRFLGGKLYYRQNGTFYASNFKFDKFFTPSSES